MGIFSRIFSKSRNNQHIAKPIQSPKYDASNPNEILKIANAMCHLAANAGDSGVYIALQDANTAKGIQNYMSLLASIDNCSGTCQHNVSSFQKFGLPINIATYLASVPFSVTLCANSTEFKLEFGAMPDYPSSLSSAIIDEMKKGLSQSRFIISGVRHAEINADIGVLRCRVD